MSALPRRPIIHAYQAVTGRRFLNRLDELNRLQWLNREELMALQREKLYRLLAYAQKYVPYYRHLFEEYGFRPGDVLTDLISFRRLPVLTKAIIHDNIDSLKTTESKRRARLSEMTTSGSTGNPLVFMQDSNYRDYVTADIHRHLAWAGWRFGDIHCYIWGANFEIAPSQGLRVKLMNWTLNRFVANAYVLSEESMHDFAAEVRRRQPRVFFSYPSCLYRFAEFVRKHGMEDIKFEALFSSAEMIYPDQRKYIEDTFGGKVFNRYGSRELGGISCECGAHTGMHASVENNYIEILKNGRPAAPAEAGDVIVTNLNNYGMPFIRYSIGDMGAWSADNTCPCGRELPMMELTQARQTDLFKTRDGRAVCVDLLFGMAGVKQFQLIQKSYDLIVARIVKSAEFEQASLDEAETLIKSALGTNVQIKYEFLEEIPVLESGKYRYVICEIDNQVTAGSKVEGK